MYGFFRLCCLCFGCLLFLPQGPQGAGEENRRVQTGNDTDHHRYGKGQNRADIHQHRYHTDAQECHSGGQRGVDRSAHTLVDAHVDQLTQRHLITLGAFVLSDTVVDNDGIIDRVAEDGQYNRDKVIVDWEAQQNKDTKGKYRAEVQSLPRCLPKRRQFF